MNKLGFLLPHTERSQLVYSLIKTINQYVVSKQAISPILFAEEVTRTCLIPSCPILTMLDVWGFDGTAIATTMGNVQMLLNTPGPKSKIFYCNDLDWLRLTQFNINFSDIYNIYSHKDLKLVARSENHAKIIKNNFGVDVADVMPIIDLEKLYAIK